MINDNAFGFLSCRIPRWMTPNDGFSLRLRGFSSSASEIWNSLRTGFRTTRNIDLIGWHDASCKRVSTHFNLKRESTITRPAKIIVAGSFCCLSSSSVLSVCVNTHLLSDRFFGGRRTLGDVNNRNLSLVARAIPKIKASKLLCFSKRAHASGSSFTFEIFSWRAGRRWTARSLTLVPVSFPNDAQETVLSTTCPASLFID